MCGSVSYENEKQERKNKVGKPESIGLKKKKKKPMAEFERRITSRAGQQCGVYNLYKTMRVKSMRVKLEPHDN